MKVIFVNRYFYPDRSFASRLLSDLAFHLIGLGVEVHVVTSRMVGHDPAARPAAEEEVNGVQVHRVWTSRFGRHLWPGRVLNYLTFHLATERCLLNLIEHGDRVVAKSDPPMLPVLVGGITNRRNAIQINWLHELFPEVAVNTGVVGLSGRVGKRLIAMRARALLKSYMTVVPGDAMRDRLQSLGISGKRLRVIRDWADDHEIAPIVDDDNPLRAEWGLRGKFVIGYVGELGKAHDFKALVGAAEQLRGERDLRFLVVGGGASMGALKRAVRKRDLTNVIFQPIQSEERMRWSIAVPDVHLVSLGREMEGLMLPAKFYRISAAGKPLLFIGAKDGEIAGWVQRARIGTTVEAGDGLRLARRIQLMRLAPERLEKMGGNAHRFYHARFSARRSLAAWADLLGLEGEGSPYPERSSQRSSSE